MEMLSLRNSSSSPGCGTRWLAASFSGRGSQLERRTCDAASASLRIGDPTGRVADFVPAGACSLVPGWSVFERSVVGESVAGGSGALTSRLGRRGLVPETFRSTTRRTRWRRSRRRFGSRTAIFAERRAAARLIFLVRMPRSYPPERT